MNPFAELVRTLGGATKTNDKLDALADYFKNAPDRDKVWVIAIFSGRRPKRIASSGFLISCCIELTGLPQWLFEECYHTVGDLAETLSLLVPQTNSGSGGLPLHQLLQKLRELEKATDSEKRDFIVNSWNGMSRNEMFVFNKLITGNFRIGVSQKMMVNALAKIAQRDPSVIAHRISGNWDPVRFPFSEITETVSGVTDFSKPYPFFLAYALEEDLSTLGEPSEWLAEWKWDGIRGEIIKRNGKLFVWSRGEELMTDKFPEYLPLESLLPEGIVIDGEIICLAPALTDTIDFTPLPFAVLQTRIGRKNITRKQLNEAPVGFIAYDLLEIQGVDYREQSLMERRKRLEEIVSELKLSFLRLSPEIPFDDWATLSLIRTKSREVGSEGIMLKRKKSVYQTGRKKRGLVEMEN